MYWADLWFSFLFFLSFISWERERRDISTSWKSLLGAMKHGESYPTDIIFSLVSPNLTCHQLAPQNLKWLRKSMKKASVWSPGLQRPQSLNYISWTYALFKALTTEEQRKQSGFSLQDLKLMCTWHGFFMWLSFQNSYTETLSCCCLCPGASHRLLPRSPTVPVVNDPDTVAHQGAILTSKDSPTSGSRLSRQRILN